MSLADNNCTKILTEKMINGEAFWSGKLGYYQITQEEETEHEIKDESDMSH